MKNMTLTNIAAACNGRLCLNDTLQQEATCVVTDSRKVEAGGVFIATRGERVDGHTFIHDVARKGALGVVCEVLPENPSLPCILVQDSFQALKEIAEFYRKQLSIRVVGITGSVGKTSTKEFVASVLAQKYSVLKTQGNFNNEVGLPLTVLSIREEHQIAVLEMGISNFGEMHRLSKIACPDICVMTNIGQCHLENLGTREGILKAKSEIFDYMNPAGYVYVNGDDDLLTTVQEKGEHPPVRYGISAYNEIYASDIINRGLFGTGMTIHYGMKVFPVNIPLPGEHMVYNALAAAGIGFQLGLDSEEIKAGIAAVKAVGGRSNVISLPGYTLIDDCYNANPVSMKAAIELLRTALGRKVAVLGDMFELGEHEADLHGEIGAYAVEKGIDVLVCVGKLSENMYKEAQSSAVKCRKGELAAAGEGIVLCYFKTRDEMLHELHSIVLPGDTILVKASHGMQFDKVVEEIKNW